MIKVTGVQKYYNKGKNSEEHVLKGVDVTIPKGVNVILGQSGSGKSTLLNLISGLDTEYDGVIEINDNDLTKINIDEYHREEVGFIYQNFNLVNHMTILENVMLSMYLDNNKSNSDRKSKATKLLSDVGLEKFLDKKPTELSGGQKQRVAIARSLANDPNIVVCDEPTGALDSKTSKEVIDIITNLANEGKTIIIVTHDRSLIDYADKVIEITDGVISKDEVINNREEEQVTKNKSKGISLLSLLKITFNNFTNRKFRNILVSLGSSIGIIGIILSLALGTGIDNGVGEIFSSIISPTSIATTIKTEGIQTGPPAIDMTDDEVEEALSILEDGGIEENYVDYSYNEVYLNYDDELVLADNGDKYNMFFQIFDYTDERQNNYSVEEETLLAGKTLEDDETGLLITKNLAAILLDKDLDTITSEEFESLVGQQMTLNLNFRSNTEVTDYDYEVTIKGVLSDSTFATLGYGSKQTFDEIYDLTNEDPFSFSITSYAQDSETAQQFSEDNSDNETFAFQTLGDVLSQISQFTSAITILIAFVAGLSLVVAAVMISIVLYIGVVERTREIGLMRSLGYTRNNIRFLFLLEGVVIIVLSNIIGLVVTFAIQIGVNPIVTDFSGFSKPIDITIMNILIVFLITLIVALISGVYPARKAAKLDPATAIRYE